MANDMDHTDLARVVLDAAEAEHIEVWIEGYDEAVTRFSGNEINQNVARATVSVAVRAAFGQRVGIASTTEVSAAGAVGALRRAEDSAQSSAPDEEYLPPPGPQKYPVVDVYDERTAALPPIERAEAVAVTGRLSREAGVESSGSYTSGAKRLFVANSGGLEAFHERSFARFTVSSSSDVGGSGWSEGYSYRVSDLDTEALAARAIGKARTGGPPRPVDAGPRTVVLEPAAFAGLMGFVSWSLDAKEADEERSAWTGKVGNVIAMENLSMRSDPLDRRLPGYPIGEDGLAARRVEWIENGVLRQLAYTRYWASRNGVEPTGYADNLAIEGGIGTDSDLIRDVQDGLLVTRFWYLNLVDEMVLSTTGMTRGGLFRIERGEVTHALTNLRFNDSPLRFLKRVRRTGTPVLTYTEFDEAMLCPPVIIDELHFTSGASF